MRHYRRSRTQGEMADGTERNLQNRKRTYKVEKDEIAKLLLKKRNRITFKTHKDNSKAKFVKIIVDN